jgi:hypothetical protein
MGLPDWIDLPTLIALVLAGTAGSALRTLATRFRIKQISLELQRLGCSPSKIQAWAMNEARSRGPLAAIYTWVTNSRGPLDRLRLRVRAARRTKPTPATPATNQRPNATVQRRSFLPKAAVFCCRNGCLTAFAPAAAARAFGRGLGVVEAAGARCRGGCFAMSLRVRSFRATAATIGSVAVRSMLASLAAENFAIACGTEATYGHTWRHETISKEWR